MSTVSQSATALNPLHLYRSLQDLNVITADSTTQPSIVVALSGGLDSMVMLRLMLELRYQYQVSFSAIHINHGLSENADDWQSFVTQYCQINDIELSCHQLVLEKTAQRSLEQIARDARYAVFADSLPVGTFVLTGHHLLDQVETFMMRLSRGSGSKGLSAMRPCADLPNSMGQSKQIRLVRPLLSLSKAELIQYAKQEFLDWIEDESNACLDFDRNFIRHKVSPTLTERWPHMASAIKTTTDLLSRESDLLSLYLQQDLSGLIENRVFGFECLNLAKLAQLNTLKQPELVRLFIANHTTRTPSRNVLTEVMTTVINSKEDSQALVEFSGYSLRQYRGYLYCLKLTSEAVPQTLTLDTRSNEPNSNELMLGGLVAADKTQTYSQELPSGSLFAGKTFSISVLPSFFKECHRFNQVEADSEKNAELLVQVKWGQIVGKIQPNVKSGNKKVSELLKQKGCPAWLRERMPNVYINNQLAAVGEIAVAFELQPHIKVQLD
ncbi:tRNA lysidine(34) synthetase TilS [Psychrosphaera haliotis]|uniref:tRNA(Ile)-lysidine synthase n=1 Tax=Psychrosphaera haliotis TaxID=555083 RepID=A0A6N8FAX9_9GAMM|nr:tRNA lysidine(34) synthetase TilS [Psychrosphaera haliotis]MUH71551.1 tRNA lysidine(34) synthetase TilS [Psychrosphaera haliotis]